MIYGYIRKSSDEGASSSFETQKFKIQSYCNLHNLKVLYMFGLDFNNPYFYIINNINLFVNTIVYNKICLCFKCYYHINENILRLHKTKIYNVKCLYNHSYFKFIE